MQPPFPQEELQPPSDKYLGLFTLTSPLALTFAGSPARSLAAPPFWRRCSILRIACTATSSSHRTLTLWSCPIFSGHISHLLFGVVAFFTTSRVACPNLTFQVGQNPGVLTDFTAPLLIQSKNFFNQPLFFEFAFSIILRVSS